MQILQGIYLPINGKSDVGTSNPSLWLMLTGPYNNPALMFLNEEFKNRWGFAILAALNGYYPNGLFTNIEVRGKDIYVNNELVMRIRGWGYLIGTLRLNEEQASEIQGKFAEHIIKSLKLEVDGTE